jgi:phosphinothricin acetyltransferase
VASLALHERAGFRTVGVYARHGRLAGEWRDCVIVEKLLGEAAGASESTPSPPPRPPAGP